MGRGYLYVFRPVCLPANLSANLSDSLPVVQEDETHLGAKIKKIAHWTIHM